MISLTDLTNLIADAEKLPSASASVLHRRIRMIATKSYIPALKLNDGRHEVRLTLEGACRARVMSLLIDLSMDADTLTSVSRKFDQRRSDGASTFDAVLAAIRAGWAVGLLINLFHDPRQGTKHLGVLIDGLDADRSPRIASALAHIVSQASVLVPLNTALQPVIAYFDEH